MQEEVEYDIYPKSLAEEYKKRRFECGADMYSAISIKQDDLNSRLKQIRKNYNFFGAPVGMIITVDRSFGNNGWGHVGMFLENLWLIAIHHGLGICLQESWSIYPKTVKKYIDHPDNEIVWCGVAIGYEDENHPINKYRTRRENLDSFVKFID